MTRLEPVHPEKTCFMTTRAWISSLSQLHAELSRQAADCFTGWNPTVT